MTKRTLIILGHPASDSFCGFLVNRYAEGVKEGGSEVKIIRLSELSFNPILNQGYRNTQDLEPDLVAAQQDILWAEHLVLVYPLWWGAMPALLKGFIDRVFLPKFAFRYRKNSVLWDRLLAGRSAHVLVTMDTPPWYFRWVYRMPGHHQIKQTILEFSGIKPVKIFSFGPIRGSSEHKRKSWAEKARRLGLYSSRG